MARRGGSPLVDNPYHPPAARGGHLGAETGHGSGSSRSILDVGRRRRFRARTFLLVLVATTASVGAWAWLFHACFGPPEGLLRFLGITLFLFVTPALGLYTGFPTAARRRSRRQVSVDVRFVPRLEHGWLDRLESADDVGWLSIEPDLLTFDGDRTHLEIDRRDVVGLWRQWSGSALVTWGPDTWLELDPALDGGRRSLRLWHRAPWSGPWTVLENRRLRRRLEAWYRG